MQDRFRFRVIDNKKDSDTYGKMFYKAEYAYDYISEVPAECFGDLVDCENEDWIVEQCTGLKDKNGKLIYEGDILKCVHSEIMKYKIYWARCGYRMKVYGTDNKLVDDTVIFLDTSTLEIIGNIHENKDLLGEE